MNTLTKDDLARLAIALMIGLVQVSQDINGRIVVWHRTRDTTREFDTAAKAIAWACAELDEIGFCEHEHVNRKPTTRITGTRRARL